ncbi:MAG: peptidase M56 [Ruminococcaceae bacterium]|nr:peptidase M56 [Oscillospiraceae bacterium]
MSNLFSNLLAMSIAGSAVVGLMLLLRPVTAKIFPAKWQYGIGKMAIAFFLLPVFLFAGKLPLVQPVMEGYPAEPSIIQKALPALPTLPSNGFVYAMDTLMEKHLTVELTQAILLIWILGAMVFAGWHFYCYRRFSKQLRADIFRVPDDTSTAALLSSCKAALGIHGEVKLMLNPKITSPMLVGLRRPMILLPTSNMQELDLKLVLIHELMHLKRKDLWVKMLALLAGTLHWFNPFVHVLRKDISTWGELSCDEALASKMSHEERKLYGEAILNALDNHSGMNTAFCSSLCESRKHIERRLIRMLNVKKTKKYIAVFAVVAIVAIGSIGTAVAALAADNMPKIDTDKVDMKLDITSRDIIKEIPMATEALPKKAPTLLSEKIDDTIQIYTGQETLISVKLSDERKFTLEEWQDILKKIENGEIRVEAEK